MSALAGHLGRCGVLSAFATMFVVYARRARSREHRAHEASQMFAFVRALWRYAPAEIED